MDMVHGRGRGKLSLLFANVTQGIGGNKGFAYSPPPRIITTAGLGVAEMFVVMGHFFFCVFVTKAAVCKIGTAAVGAGLFGLARQNHHLRGTKKGARLSASTLRTCSMITVYTPKTAISSLLGRNLVQLCVV